MSEAIEIELDFQRDGKPGAGVLRVVCGDETLAAERVDLLDREQRETFIGRLCNARPGIDRESLAGELLRLSAMPVQATAPVVKRVRPGPPWIPFPVDVLPELLRDFVATGAESIGCDSSMIVLPALATLGGAVGTTRQIHLRGLWYEYPITWAGTVADSGTLKSPAMDYALRPLRDIQSRRFVEHDAAVAEYETATIRYEAALSEYKRRPAKGAERGDPPTKPAAPVCIRHLTTDATVESLIPILVCNPRGILLARDELGGWLQSFNQYKSGRGGDLQNWLEMFRGGPVINDRKGTGTLRVSRAAVSVCGTIQPGTLQRLLTPEFYECGLVAQLLLASPPKRMKHWTDTVPDSAAVQAYSDIVGALTRLEHRPDGGSVALRMTAGARAAFVSFYNGFAVEQFEADGDLAASFSKVEGYVPRLALIFALVDDPHAECVPGEAMESAIAIGRWFAREAERIYGHLAEKPEEREARVLVEWIFARGGTTTVRELMQGTRRYRSDHERAVGDLEALVRAGLAVSEIEGGGSAGRPLKRYRLVEGVYETMPSGNETLTGDAKTDFDSVDTLGSPPGAFSGGLPVGGGRTLTRDELRALDVRFGNLPAVGLVGDDDPPVVAAEGEIKPDWAEV